MTPLPLSQVIRLGIRRTILAFVASTLVLAAVVIGAGADPNSGGGTSSVGSSHAPAELVPPPPANQSHTPGQ